MGIGLEQTPLLHWHLVLMSVKLLTEHKGSNCQ